MHASPPHPPRNAAHFLLVAGFVVTMLAPLAGLLQSTPETAGLEKRTRAPRPAWPRSVADWQRFPGRFEQFFNDRFALRDDLITLHNRLCVTVLGTSPKPAVLLGRDGWLFFNSREVENTDSLGDFAGTPLSDAQRTAWSSELERYRTQLAARGIKFVVAVAPNKEGLYPGQMPAGYQAARGPRAIDQWFEAMRKTTQVPLVDLRKALHESPEFTNLYARTDTHWNSAGAAVAYRALVQAFAQQDLACRVANIETSQIAEEPGGDLAGMLGLPDVLREPSLPACRVVGAKARVLSSGDPHTQLKTYMQDDASLPAALVLRDSFSEALEPFLAESFRRLDLHWGVGLDEAYLTAHKPDVVLLICAERNLRADPRKLRRDRFNP